jgi:peptide/nickel transport system substrate-binding protein
MLKRSKWLGAAVTFGVVAVMASNGFAVASAAAAHPHVAKAHAQSKAGCVKVTPKGTVKYSDWQFPSTLNGYLTTQAVSKIVDTAIFDGLFSVNQKAQFVPFQLTKYPTVKNGGISKDGKTITLTLKPGLKWSDGKPLTAADMKFGWQVDMTKTTGPACLGYCDVISKFDVVNSLTAKLTLKHPAPTDEAIGFDVWPSFGWPHAYSKGNYKQAAKWFETATTTFEDSSYPTNGPYEVQSYTAGDRIVMVPDKHYSDFTCGARLKQLIFVGYADKPSMEAAAASHDTDMTQDYTAADLPALKQNASKYKIYQAPAYIIEHLELNVLDKTVNGHPNALTNVKVRQALNLALDKTGLIKSALGLSTKQAQAVEANSIWIITSKFSMAGADKTITGAWDPLANKGKGAYVTPGTAKAVADAKKLLTQAGFSGGNGVTVDVESTAGNAVRLQQMDIMQQNWNKLGVTTNVKQSPTFLAGWDSGGDLNHGNFSAADFAWLLGPDPDADYKTFFLPQYIERIQSTPADSQENFAGVNNATMTKLWKQAYLTSSSKTRKSDYKQIQDLVAKQVYWIPLYYRPTLATVDNAFTGFSLNPTSVDDAWNVFAWKASAS